MTILGRLRARWIISRLLVLLPEIFFAAAVITVDALTYVVARDAPGQLAVVAPLDLICLLVLPFVFVMFEVPPWVNRTRYRLRRFEEASAQRAAHPIPTRSQDLTWSATGAAFGTFVYEWRSSYGILSPERARELPPRPESWLRPVDVLPPMLIRLQGRAFLRALLPWDAVAVVLASVTIAAGLLAHR
ncbi:hypothetical protein BH11ACT3_BH11ACT3_21010 [soil metagenome]